MKRIDLGPTPLAYPLPAFLVGTYDSEGRANIMTVAWGGICCSEPPCIAISVRPGRYSHDAILARKAFTVNVPSVALAGKVDFAGMACGKNSDKFMELGLTAERSSRVDAPCVAQCPLILECSLRHTLELGSHTQFVGEILNVSLLEVCLEDGAPDIQKIDPLLYDGGQKRYHCVGEPVGRAFSLGKRFMGRG
ncbi:MAG TPA: flavin reductase family protein [Candidatus Desulfovibrio intestinigallinarum]|nr:flavin reductase family protein [Candidatus Desulfovibrio intestinigallinarum]